MPRCVLIYGVWPWIFFRVFYRWVYGDLVLGASLRCVLGCSVLEVFWPWVCSNVGVCSAKRSVVSDRVLFGKEEVSDLSSMGAVGYGWLKIRRMYEAWVFGVGHGW
ncbi:hypothetical protein CsSME_00031531 [Camellia sinensis var. sinensis]